MRDQFWTTRGHALVQVNYVGSSGYCKEYINLLNLQWGVNDVADAVSCVEYLGKGRPHRPQQSWDYRTFGPVDMRQCRLCASIRKSGPPG
jgi:hypothetical protein